MLLIESMKYSAHLPHAMRDVYEVFPHLPSASHNVCEIFPSFTPQYSWCLWSVPLTRPMLFIVSVVLPSHVPLVHGICDLSLPLTHPMLLMTSMKSSPHLPNYTCGMASTVSSPHLPHAACGHESPPPPPPSRNLPQPCPVVLMVFVN